MARTFPRFFSPPPSPVVTGSVTVTPSLGTTNAVSLSGNGSGWSTNGPTLTLKPLATQSLSVWYQLTFSCSSGFTLTGIQISNGSDSAIFFPASAGSVTLNLLSDVGTSETQVDYVLGVGVQEGSLQVHWIGDPTIAFEPQAGPPSPIWPEER